MTKFYLIIKTQVFEKDLRFDDQINHQNADDLFDHDLFESLQLNVIGYISHILF